MRSKSTTTTSDKVTATTDNRFAFDVLRHDGPVLVDFHAPWCRTCQVLEPVLDDLAPNWSDRLRIVSIDIEHHPGAAQRHHVQSIPTLVLFDHGIEVDRLGNVVRHQRIDDWLHAHIGQQNDPTPGRTQGHPMSTTTPDRTPGIRSEGGHHVVDTA